MGRPSWEDLKKMKRSGRAALVTALTLLVSLATVAPTFAAGGTSTAVSPAAAASYGTGSQFVSTAIWWTGFTRNQIAWSNPVSGPWCGQFVSQMAHNANVRPSAISQSAGDANEQHLFPGSSWHFKRTGQDAYLRRGTAGYAPAVGDFVFISKQTGDVISHVGIVQGWDGTRMYTVEGNPPAYGYQNADTSVVTRRMYTYNTTHGYLILAGQTTNGSVSMSPGNFPASQGTPSTWDNTIRAIDVITPNW